jgi:WD40 repeat protein
MRECFPFLSPDGRQIATISWDFAIQLWDMDEGRANRQNIHGRFDNSDVIAVELLPSGRVLVSQNMSGVVQLWDAASGALLKTIERDGVETITLSPDEQLLASGSGDGGIDTWEMDSTTLGEHVRSFRGHKGLVGVLTFSVDGRLMASYSRGECIILWSVSTGALLQRFGVDYDRNVEHMAFSSLGPYLEVKGF